HGGDHRRRRAGPLSGAPTHLARMRARLAGVLGRPARRAGRDVASRAAAPQAEAERVHPRPAILPEHPAPPGRAIPASRHRSARRRDAHGRDRLPTLGELVPEIRGRGARMERTARDDAQEAALGQRRALLPALRGAGARPNSVTSRVDPPEEDVLRPTVVEVSLACLAENFRAIKAAVAPAAVMPIVKANAYGHGLVEIARHLVTLGATSLGVAFLEEAVALRGAGITLPILVMGG